MNRFNPRARAGRDISAAINKIARDGFNPRARAGRDLTDFVQAIGTNGFNPRARAGRDINEALGVEDDEVSIHAPARGATSAGKLLTVVTSFQSTRPRGARLYCFFHIVIK